MSLTAEQLDVIRSSGSLQVIACPGSGKTRTLVELFVSLAAERRSGNVAVLSFTNAAAEEIEARASASGVACDFPHFVGTFDAFIARYLVCPFRLPGSTTSEPRWTRRVVSSWDELGANVRGVSLDDFSLEIVGSEDPKIRLSIPPRLGRQAAARLKTHPRGIQGASEQTIRTEWLRLAGEEHRGWRSAGYLSSADARVVAAWRLSKTLAMAGALDALRARFSVVIVDESQDADEFDSRLVDLLAKGGARTVVLGDPDQAIYGFRSSPRSATTRPSVPPANVASLTGNHRSGMNVCRVAASLRSQARVDDPVGRAAGDVGTVRLWGVTDGFAAAGVAFEQLCEGLGVPAAQRVILAHRWSSLREFGVRRPGDASAALAPRLAAAVRVVAAAESAPAARLSALVAAERLVGRRIGLKESSSGRGGHLEQTTSAWIREVALAFLSHLADAGPPDPGDAAWIATARRWLDLVEPPRGYVPVRASSFLKAVAEAPPPEAPAFTRVTTVHSMKGLERDAVLVVIPEKNIGEALDAWEHRRDDDGRRVLYVAATRARRVLCFVVPSACRARVGGLLRRHDAEVEESDLVSSCPKPEPQRARGPSFGTR